MCLSLNHTKQQKQNKMKTFGIKFVTAGTMILNTTILKSNSRIEAKNYIIEKYGYCSYLTISEI